MKIVDHNGKEVSQAQALAQYFRKPDETVSMFMEQLKKLTPADKEELALGAAKNLGHSIVE